jgi:hypothetical protein
VSVGTVWVWFFVPETKGVPLEEMAAIFGDTDDVVIYLRDVHLDQHTSSKPTSTEDGQGVELETRNSMTDKVASAV